jgi:uncharacterized protein (DUF2062 family)
MREYIRDRIRSLFQLNDPPHKLALAFALGIFIAFTPTIGLHIVSCLALAWIFRLSKVVIITASFVNNPWTIVPLYGFCIWFGIMITGSDISVPVIAWDEMSLATAYQILKPYLWPYIAGTMVMGTTAGILSYFLFYRALIRFRKTENQ